MFLEFACGIYNKIPGLKIEENDNICCKDIIAKEPISKPGLDDIIKNEICKFKLPISYLDKDELYVLSDTVSTDIELVNSENKSMYEYLFNPEHDFAKFLIPEWKRHYTTNIHYLNDTQTILKKMGDYKIEVDEKLKCIDCDDDEPIYKVKCDEIKNCWNTIKNDEDFLSKYSFIEWDMFKHLNQSSSFLQIMSFMNITSPLMSLCLPILLLIFPFILLKIQGIPISFSTYLDVLKDIAKSHFIGNSLYSLKSLNFENIVYLIFTLGLYLLQIYQNINSCIKFYSNTQLINNTLVELRQYTGYSIHSMESYMNIISGMDSYSGFHNEVEKHKNILKKIGDELNRIYEFTHSINKFNDTGYMLKCFYELYSNKEYEESLIFSMGFEGYMNNMLGAYNNYILGNVSFTSYDISGSCSFKKQYYPPLVNESPVKNNCSLVKNMIISAPNKAGKTTILKTTTINIIFSQQIGCGFYESAVINPYTHIHSYLNIPDTSGRDSLFQAESRRCKEIIDIININNNDKYRHFCIFDELYSGTNPEEAGKAGCAFLQYLSGFSNVNFMLTTHYTSICKKFRKSSKIQNYKMVVEVLDDGKYKYTYKLIKGLSKMKGAVRVLKDMEYPKEIIDSIENH